MGPLVMNKREALREVRRNKEVVTAKTIAMNSEAKLAERNIMSVF
jgi:hypothetical protein